MTADRTFPDESSTSPIPRRNRSEWLDAVLPTSNSTSCNSCPMRPSPGGGWRANHASFLGVYCPITHLYLCNFHSWYSPFASQSAMPICALTEQAAMVIPDCSLLVTTFSRQSWPLQSTATRGTSMVSFVDGELPGWLSLCRVHATNRWAPCSLRGSQ